MRYQLFNSFCILIAVDQYFLFVFYAIQSKSINCLLGLLDWRFQIQQNLHFRTFCFSMSTQKKGLKFKRKFYSLEILQSFHLGSIDTGLFKFKLYRFFKSTKKILVVELLFSGKQQTDLIFVTVLSSNLVAFKLRIDLNLGTNK